MNIFDAAKDAVTIPEAAREYGFTPTKAGYICCPFHTERTPSLRLYPRSYHCFGCGAHGSVIDFVANLYGITPMDAVKRLNDDFRLGLEIDRPPDHKEQRRRQEIQEARKLFDEWREQMLDMMGAAIRVANLADYEYLTEAENIAIIFKEGLEYWSGILLHGSLADQMEIFRDREEVKTLCQKILGNTPKRLNTA